MPTIQQLLPECDLISDATLREKVISIWTTMAAATKFATLMDVPVLPNLRYPQITHNRSAATLALQVATVLHDFHGVDINRDMLLAAALLQDVSKLVEYEPDGESVVRSEIGTRFQHGFYAGHLALQAGLSLEMAEIILDHTYASSRFPRTLIGKILFYVDQIDMAALNGDRWQKTMMISR